MKFNIDVYRFGHFWRLLGTSMAMAWKILVVGHDVLTSPGEAPQDTNNYVLYGGMRTFDDFSGSPEDIFVFGAPQTAPNEPTIVRSQNALEQRDAHVSLADLLVTPADGNYDVGNSGVVGVGDFNGDGRADLAILRKQPQSGPVEVIIHD